MGFVGRVEALRGPTGRKLSGLEDSAPPTDFTRHLTVLGSPNRFLLSPPQSRRLECHSSSVLRMRKRHLPGVKVEWFIFHSMRLNVAELVVRLIHRIADDWISEMPEVDADLIRSARVRSDA